ncbi:metal ABC transporter substrate-binding protein [Blastococcus sp. VKM Ac-2987]|uniref:metal ABC transporter substrate-binding protein n=1 Tax=Blastococcus sp. VKM Ac-2987 TaxID=3004141 RepID=UPI0022AB80B6|nr:metal ABC transporter substrate-binding protein [Blastococcus sp. VKM Ac-2987]MCZ2860496.1 metal ABC transporter substrate-binding protein [Blastococcus sp. VKM Ac-2987]
MTRPGRLGVFALAGCLGCGLTGCGGDQAGAADDGRVDVVVSSYPLEYVAAEVGGDRVDVTNLVPAGGDSHGLEPTPRDVMTLTEADVVVHLSGALQPAIDDVLAQQEPEHVVDATALADHGEDPHFWLDPVRLAPLGTQVADELAVVDPDHADRYAERAERLAASLQEMDEEYATALAPCRGATLLASHEAFGYLTERYGLRQVGVAGLDPHVEVSPTRLRRVVDDVRDTGARTIFFEAAAGLGVAETLADELGLATDVLHPIERVADEESYPGLMTANLAALRRGLVCTG